MPQKTIYHPTPEPLRSDLARVWGLLLPLALISSTGIVFLTASQWLEKDAAYLLGFALCCIPATRDF
jgi:hypothetical protein